MPSPSRYAADPLARLKRHETTGGDPDCRLCFPWEGRILSLTGKTEGFPTYEEARKAGCFHPNCVHTLDPVDELLDADEIELQRAHPVDMAAAGPDELDENRYEIDQDRYRRKGMDAERARVAVDRDNLEASIRQGLLRDDAREVVDAMTDAQVTALCRDGNPPAFEPVRRVKGGTRGSPKYEDEKWNRGRRGGTVHVARDADAAHILAVTGADKEAQKKRDEFVFPIEEVRKMKIQDALKLKQIADLIPDAATRFDEAERQNNADAARIEEITEKINALCKLPPKERIAHFNEFKRLTEERENSRNDLRRNVFKRNVEAFGFNGDNCTVKTGRVSPSRRSLFMQAKDGLEKLYADGVFPERPLIVNAERGSRAYHMAGELFLPNECDASVTVHEASHFVEFGNPHVHERCLEFLRYRTAGETAQPLRILTGNSAYRRNELARPDKFFHPYCGKDYGDRATEILSMGVERLTREPRKFYNSDPEYFLFCVGIIRGKL